MRLLSSGTYAAGLYQRRTHHRRFEELAREGGHFSESPFVYPSATMVNGTALVTGIIPGRNGIIANHVYRPDIDPKHAIDVELRQS